jgi:putative chitinase
MNITPSTLSKLAARPLNDNMISAVRGLLMRPMHLSSPHRLYHFLGQSAHESGGWRYDREVWGPTPAQKRYDTRTDLGNTVAADGDGYAYRGRAGFQITGKANYRRFTDWAQANYASAPNFVAVPDLINTDPWEGLASIWYWETNGLNALADAGDVAAVTRRINGGINGLEDRVRQTVAAGLLLAGYADVRSFQADNRLTADGIAGPITKATLHRVLRNAPPVMFALD